MLSSVSRVGQVLDLFTPETPEWGVSEVALRLGIAKSSAHALLTTLDNIGLVRRIPEGRYRLGWKISELNRTLRDSTDVLSACRRRLQRLADGLGAIVHVAGLHGREIVYLDRVIGYGSPSVVEANVGMTMPAHCTALGKVLLASLQPHQADAMVARYGLARRTAQTITSLQGLHDELDCVRLRGFARDLQEAVNGVCCVAAPIRDSNGEVDAAISLTMPAAKFRGREGQLPTAVRSAAGEILRNRTFCAPARPTTLTAQ